MRGMVWSTRLTNDTTAADIERKLTPFSEERNKPHYYVMAYPTDSVSANELLFNVARHNFNSFVVKDFDLEQMTFGRMGLLLVKGFANFNEVSHYKSVLEADKGLVLDRSIKAAQCVNVVTADGDCLVAGAKRNRVDRRGIRLSRLLEWHSHYLLLQFSS